MINQMHKMVPKLIKFYFCSFFILSCNLPPGSTGQTEVVATTTQATDVPTLSAPKEIEDNFPETIPDGLVIDFWHPWSGNLANLVSDMADEFNEENKWGISVVVTDFADEQVLALGILETINNKETLPDLIAAPGYLLSALTENNITPQNLNPYLNSSVWGISKVELDSFFPVFWKSDEDSGSRIGIPAYRSGNFLFYNQSWAEDMGFFQTPDSTESFREQMCAASRVNQNSGLNEKIGTGGWVYSYDPYAFLSWLKSFNGAVTGTGREPISFNHVQNVAGGIFLYDMFLPVNNCAWLGRQTLPYQYFSRRQAMAYSGIMEDILIQEKVNQLNQVDDEWKVIPYPSNAGKPVLFVTGSSYAILPNNEDQSLAAWEFIRWMINPENQARIVQETGSFPLSTNALTLLEDFRVDHPQWTESVSYLPFAEPASSEVGWAIAKEILSDITWQLIQFTTSRDDIAGIFLSADNLFQEVSETQ